MTSEILSNGPAGRPANLLILPEAIDHVGPRVCPEWDGSERIEAGGAADATPTTSSAREPIEPMRPAPATGVCATCGAPATLIRLGKAYCKAHAPKPLPIPAALRRDFRRPAAQFPAALAKAPSAEPGAIAEPPGEAIDQGALFRWTRAHAAIRDKVLAGELLPQLRDGRAMIQPAAEEWRAEGFPAPDEARARHARRGHIPMFVIFDVVDLDKVFPPSGERQAARTASEGRKGKTGPKTDRTQRATADLLGKLNDGSLTPEQLRDGYTAASIAKEYGIGQTAAGKARENALAQFAAIPNRAE